MIPSLSILNDRELEMIRDAAIRVLEKKGLRFTVGEILALFRRCGFSVSEEGVVRISREQLEAALKTVPRVFVRHGSVQERDVVIGEGRTKFGIGSIPIWVVERGLSPSRRPATLADFKRFTALSESLEGYEIGNPVVQPREIPDEVMHVLWNRNNAVRMTKPSCCWYATSFKTAEEGLELLRLAAGGLEELRSSRRWAITICPDSAMQWGRSAIGALVMAAAYVPVDVLPMPFLGSMYPVTIAGALVQATAETLGIVVLCQLVRPGCPVLHAASYGGIMDMAIGNHSFGAPESALLASASAVVGRSFGLPTNIMQGTSDSKIPDQQAAYEKTLTYILPALAEADCITQAGALLDFALSASYEQLVIEDEIVQWVKRIADGICVERDTLAEEEILNLPFGGNYLESEHTLRFFRKELVFPKLADRRKWEQWYGDGAKDVAQRAGERAKKLVNDYTPVLGIPEDRRDAVDEYAEAVLLRHGVNPEPLLY